MLKSAKIISVYLSFYAFFSFIVKANPDGIYGDLNRDNIVDSRDITLLGRYILEIYEFDDKQLKYADLNLDNKVDSIDYNIMKRYLLKLSKLYLSGK